MGVSLHQCLYSEFSAVVLLSCSRWFNVSDGGTGSGEHHGEIPGDSLDFQGQRLEVSIMQQCTAGEKCALDTVNASLSLCLMMS